jgi:hemolysin activation/secretion protein
MKGSLNKIFVHGMIALLFPGMAMALPLPPTIIPSRMSPTNPPPNGGIKPAPPPFETTKVETGVVNETAMKIKFQFKKLVLEGNTVYSYKDLEPLFKDQLGKQISLADLQKIANDIQNYYTGHGYILTRVIIPPQEIDASGLVKIKIVEGYVSDIVIDGDTKNVKKLIEAYVAPILESKPLQIEVMERAVLLINDIPGIETKAVITPSFDVPGSSTFVLVVSQSVFDGNITWDDRGTKYVGQNEFSTTLQLNNIFGGPGQLEFDGKVTSDTNELRSGNLQYTAEIFDNGSTLLGGYTLNRVLPGNSLTPLHINGLSSTTSVIYTYPFIRTRRMNLSGTLSYDYLNSTNEIDQILVALDRIESVRASAIFNAMDNMQGMNLLTGQYSQGIQLFSGNAQPELLRSRLVGQKNYSKANLTYSRLQALQDNWSFFISMSGQLAFNSLLAPEQIGYGGAQYGSAYDQSEIIGDTGFEGKAELRYNGQPGQFFRTTQYYLSYDGGVLYDKNVITDPNLPPDASTIVEQNKQSGTSAAAGIRLALLNRVSSDFQVAKPLTRKVAANNNKAARFFFSIVVDIGPGS